MCPVLRGEASPLPQKELTALRDTLSRDWGHRTLSTPSGPLLVMRVPADRPDLLTHLETATDHLPPLDYSEYRGAVMIGDGAHLGVSIDMLRSLIDTRRASEANWLTQHRRRLSAGTFTIERLPSDPQRRLRAVIRVDADQVSQLAENDFDALATLLEPIKEASPGQCRPAFAYLVAHEDHVRIEGGRFFSELDQRADRLREREERARRRKRESSYETALGHLARIEEQKRRRKAPDPLAQRPRHGPFDAPFRSRSTKERAAMDPPRRTRREETPDLPPGFSPGARERLRHDAPPGPFARRQQRRSSLADAMAGPMVDPVAEPVAEPPARRDPQFEAVDAHPEQYQHLKTVLLEAGYETRERFVVDGVPLALAAARPQGYPRRVLVAFSSRLEGDEARRMLRVARSVAAELAIAITAHKAPDVDRVTLATNLKVIAPDAVMQLRLD